MGAVTRRFVPEARCFFFNDTATTEIYALSLHDALPISAATVPLVPLRVTAPAVVPVRVFVATPAAAAWVPRPLTLPAPESLGKEETTAELQSRLTTVCLLLLVVEVTSRVVPEARSAGGP